MSSSTVAEKGGKATITIRTIISREGAGTIEGIAATTEVATVMSMKKYILSNNLHRVRKLVYYRRLLKVE